MNRIVEAGVTMGTTGAVAVAFSLLLAVSPAVQAHSFTFSTVALSSQPAPGTEAGVAFASLNAPSLNAAGQCAFGGSLMGPTITSANASGLWIGTSSHLALLAREGSAAPGTAAGIVYSTFGDPRLDAAGQCSFWGTVTGPNVTGGNSKAIWSGVPGTVALLARDGDQAPGTLPGVIFGRVSGFFSFSSPSLNMTGESAFLGYLDGPDVVSPGNESGLWIGSPGNLSLLARAGDPAPGMAAGVTYASFAAPSVNEASQVVFGAALRGPGVTAENREGIFRGDSNNLGLVVRTGNLAPGAGANFSWLSALTINSTGECAFFAKIAGAGVTSANDFGLWFVASATVGLVAREGDPAPGAAAGVTFLNFGAGTSTAVRQTPRINSQGETAFLAFVTGPGITTGNDSGIWMGEPGSMRRIVAEGDTAPDLSDGALFGDIQEGPIAMNDRGEVVFFNRLAGPGVTTANDGSLWFVDAQGGLTLILREGASFQVAPGDVRTVRALSFIGGSADEDGDPSGLNDSGQVALLATFTGGSDGIFVASALAVPRVTAIAKVGNEIQLQGAGIPNALHKVHATDDILQPFDPTPMGTVTADSNGNFQFTDNTNLPRRFYRVVYP